MIRRLVEMSGYFLVALGLIWVLAGIYGFRQNRRRGKRQV
jgi:formate hydrogenlyase subunit 3/multisubunit Na+/H+ antiporter MnhD subunit